MSAKLTVPASPLEGKGNQESKLWVVGVVTHEHAHQLGGIQVVAPGRTTFNHERTKNGKKRKKCANH
jgi:hypothetical protein